MAVLLGSQGLNLGAEGEQSTSMLNELFSSEVMGCFFYFFFKEKKNQLPCRGGGLELLLASGRALGGNAELLAAGGDLQRLERVQPLKRCLLLI